MTISFDLKPIDKKPARKYRKGSKYDPIIDVFLEGKEKLVKVDIEEKNANYLRTRLIKRIEAKGEKGIKISVINNVCYLERT